MLRKHLSCFIRDYRTLIFFLWCSIYLFISFIQHFSNAKCYVIIIYKENMLSLCTTSKSAWAVELNSWWQKEDRFGVWNGLLCLNSVWGFDYCLNLFLFFLFMFKLKLVKRVHGRSSLTFLNSLFYKYITNLPINVIPFPNEYPIYIVQSILV